MSARRSLVWLGLTPEPEQELPAAVAALRSPADGRPRAALLAAERNRVQRLVLRGTQRGWLRYLGEVTELVVEAAAGPVSADPGAALVAGEVVLDHHRMLIGLPGAGYTRTAAQRRDLEEALARLRSLGGPGRAAVPGPSGPSDPCGPPGASRPSGPSRSSGSSGLSGSSRPSGSSGPSGPSRSSGSSGPSDASGSSDPSRSTGPIGPVDPADPSGHTAPIDVFGHSEPGSPA
ncbi:hypothetical protein ACFZCP_21465 [Streptomyces sp. NPDC007971]|uniref:hypothetical protein n=1 Tax=Streptomyces sp. NPDC007971 TaxID=3364799 RepID=UPI0036EC9EE8